ncbi:hypothetical protein [Streptomyces tubercidicus]|uniref:hypothetical protein n=1 Tax=Streptomyces tubercidicus TaxID=47759 RepID=UPI00346574A5
MSHIFSPPIHFCVEPADRGHSTKVLLTRHGFTSLSPGPVFIKDFFDSLLKSNRSPAGIMEEYLTDVQVNLLQTLPQNPHENPEAYAQRWAAYGDVGRVHSAYQLLSCPYFTPEREQQENAADAWVRLKQEGIGERQRVKEVGIGVEVTATQAALLAKLTERAGIPYDQSQRFISAAPLLEGLARQGGNAPQSSERTEER